MRHGKIIASFLILGVSLLALFRNLLIHDPLLERDDLYILSKIKGFSTYQDWSKVFVYQPLRDLTLFIDLRLKELLGFGTFHLSNLLLWGLSLIIIYRIFVLLDLSRRIRLWVLFVYAIHPALLNSVAWVSSRKHLLSYLLILIATWALLKTRFQWASGRKKFGFFGLSAAAYLLSLLAHPINLLWPVWALIAWNLLRGRADSESPANSRFWILTATAAPFILLVLGVAWINYSFYSGPYVAHLGVEKIIPTGWADFSVRFLALGRYVFNFVFPVKIAPLYHPGSLANLLGALLIPFLILLSMKFAGKRETAVWGLAFLLPLLPTLILMTQVFTSDTYLLSASGGGIILLALNADQLSRRLGSINLRRALEALAIATVIFFFSLSLPVVRSWESDLQVWKRAYTLEPSTRSATLYGDYLIRSDRADDAMAVALEFEEKSGRPLLPLLGKAVYFSRKLGPHQKLKMLFDIEGSEPWFHYYRALIAYQLGEQKLATREINKALKQPGVFGEELELVKEHAATIRGSTGK